MQPCTLEVGDRVVVESAGGPLEAEYTLFDAGGIELLSDGPGTIREAGYLTTAGDARIRLEAAGISDLLAAEVASAMQPTLSVAYAIGASAKKMATQLGPGELFESRAYEAGVRQYVGRWLDLQALARDTGVLRATAALQAIFLHSLLCELLPETRVFMSTLGYTRDRRPGERTYRRVGLETAAELPAALRALAANPPAGLANVASRATGPSRTELLDAVNLRAAACAIDVSRDRLQAIARALMVRDVPPRGPLADAELWAIEGQLSHGDAAGVIEKLDAIERARGRLPGTAYLRARAALLLGSEKPLAIAERVSSLSANMNTFFELELLAAEAWKAAGDKRKAKAFARDLVDNPNAPDELRIRALDILDTRSSQALQAAAPVSPSDTTPRSSSRPPSSGRSSRASSTRPPRAAKGAAEKDARLSAGAVPKAEPSRPAQKPESRRPAARTESRRIAAARPESRRPDARREEDDEAPDTAIDPAPVVQIERAAAVDEPTMRDRIPGPLSKPPPAAASTASRDDHIPPPPRTPVLEPIPRPASQPPVGRTTRPLRRATSSAPPPGSPPPQSSPPPAHAHDVTKVSTAYNPGTPEAVAEIVHAVAIPVDRVPSHAPQRPPSSPPLAATMPSHPPAGFMRGASQPPFKIDSHPPPPLTVPRQSPPPRNLRQHAVEFAEALSLPPGLHGQPPPRDELPKSAIDARVAFTHMSRELGKDYRQRLRVELRTDTAGIEAMQRYLHDRFADGQIRTREDAYDVRRHGAFMSEILARQLGAYWVDIGPSELGYWAMVVGSSLRVFPFGRVLRFVSMGPKERDLVSYYLELEGRAKS